MGKEPYVSGYPRGGSQRREASPHVTGARKNDVALPVAVIDGPYDVTALSGILTQTFVSLGKGSCAVGPSSACGHGTFILGLLGARRDALIPGLCPECRLLHVPLFVDDGAPSASVAELAKAIRVAITAGARLINLSLAILSDHPQNDPELAAALDVAEANGATVLVAAGNQGHLAMGQLLSHPVTIPVVAVDAAHRLLPESNFGPLISRRGVAALGQQVFGYAPGGGTTIMSGTSVATAVATGTLAQLWSVHPDAEGADIRAAVAGLASRNDFVPPALNRDVILAALDQMAASEPRALSASRASHRVIFQRGTTMSDGLGQPAPPTGGEAAGRFGRAVVPAQGAGGCACGAPGGVCNCAGTGTSRFIYVLGTVDIRFPDQSISEELQSVALSLAREKDDHTLREPKADEPLRSWYARVLKHPEARYVARLVSWLLTVEGQPAYYLALRDLDDLPDLVGCLGRPEPKNPLEHEDLDLFVGSSTLVPVDTCPGVTAPVLAVDQLWMLKKQALTQAFELAPKTPKKPASKEKVNATVENERNELFRRLVRSADNFGDTDEWRALNYLAVRYQPLYELYAELVKPSAELVIPKDGWTLDSIKVVPSRLWREKRIVDPVFAFRNNETGVVHKYFVRVDVSHLYPMIINPIAEYFDR
jgi:Subtilase family/PatG C-terminal